LGTDSELKRIAVKEGSPRFFLDYIHQASLRPSTLVHYFFLIKSTG
jgi:hypothetical protein